VIERVAANVSDNRTHFASKENTMITIERRSLLTGAAALSAASAMGPMGIGSALAAAPTGGQQNAGWYRYKVGTHEVTVATDGVSRFKLPDAFVANKSRDEVSKGLSDAFLQPAPDMVAIPYSPIAVNTGTKLVVIDTGTGEGNFVASKGSAGQFHSNLKAAGIDRNLVDVVIISHFHGDHIGGLVTADGKASFPNAEIMVPQSEWTYFTDEAEMGRQTSDRMKGVFANVKRVFDALGRKVTPYEAGKELAPGITSITSYGHTPGHHSHIIASGDSKVFVQADVTNIPLFVRNPGWHLMFDQDAAMAEATRRKIYDMLAAEKMMVQGFHYPFPALAHIEKTATGYRETFVPWNPAL
jgi:glyoxylase-like metal-dependent hydrolase (beta-lactamase superfamily II)